MADRSTKIKADILNSIESQINPATEDKQDNIITAIQNITIPPPVGGATSANQTIEIATTQDLYNQLGLLLDRLEFGNITSNSKTLRVQLNPDLISNVIVTSGAISNTVRQGDLQMQRVNEAILDIAFINGITNNLSIT